MSRQMFRASLGALSLLMAGPCVADAYLDALKAEASSPTPAKSIQARAPGQSVLRTDDQPQMEQWLQQEFVGTFVFYQKLNTRKKDIVYQLYRDGAPIEDIRTKINELLTH